METETDDTKEIELMKTTKTKNYKSDLMRLAHKYRKRWCISLSNALKCAWKLYNIVGCRFFADEDVIINIYIAGNIIIGNHNSNICVGNENVLNSGFVSKINLKS